MNKKLTFYFKLGILFCFLVIIASCQNDNLHDASQENAISKSPPNLTATIQRGGKLLEANQNLKSQLIKLSNDKQKGNVFNSRTIYSETYDLSVDTTAVQIIETATYTSYTFIVERDDVGSDILENYVFTEFNNGNFEQFLISYPILNNGSGQEFDITNANVTSINDAALVYNREGSCASLVEYEEPVCAYTKCYDGIHSMNQDGWQSCIYWSKGYGQPTMTCTDGAWVDQGCPDTNGSTSPGGSTGNTTTGTNTNNNQDNN